MREGIINTGKTPIFPVPRDDGGLLLAQGKSHILLSRDEIGCADVLRARSDGVKNGLSANRPIPADPTPRRKSPSICNGSPPNQEAPSHQKSTRRGSSLNCRILD